MLERFALLWIRAEDSLSERRITFAWVAILALTCVAVAFVGVPRMRVYSHDIFVSLDGGWRVLHGQRPAVDFFAQLGPAYFLLHAAGLWLAGGDAGGLGYGTIFVAVLISVWSVFLLRPRLSGVTFYAAPVVLLLLAVAPFPLGLSPAARSFAMKHNRYEFALTCLVLLECLLPPRDDESPRSSLAGGFSSGLATGLVLFLKISYGFVGIGLLAVSAAFRPRERARLAGAAAGIACILLPMLAYLRFDVGALVREYRLLASVKGTGLSVSAIIDRWYLDRFEVAFMLLLAVLVASLPGVTRRRAVELLTAAVMAVGAGTLLLLTNSQPAMYPLSSMMALVLMHELSRLRRVCAPIACASLTALGGLIVAIPASLDAVGLVAAVENKLRWDVAEGGGFVLDGEHLTALEFYNNPTLEGHLDFVDNGRAFVDITNEGFDLIRRNSDPSESVRGMGMSNPFSYGLRRPPSRGGSVVLSATDVSESTVPPLEMLLGDTQLLLVPKFPDYDRPTLEILQRKYPAMLGVLYTPVAESEHWQLFRRARDGGVSLNRPAFQ
jgi:hypothetical protein